MFPIMSINYKYKIKYSIHAKLNELFDILFSYIKNFMLKYSNSPRNCTLKVTKIFKNVTLEKFLYNRYFYSI